jgi:type IV secretion system protein TrbC
MKCSSLWVRLIILIAIASVDALAGTSTGLPWENWTQQIFRSITGPVAYGAAGIGMVTGIGHCIWEGELTGFGRRALLLGLGGAGMAMAPTALSALGVSAALV